MVSHDGRWVSRSTARSTAIRELRHRLEGLGAAFVGTSDTEVLVEAVARWGVRARRSTGSTACTRWRSGTRGGGSSGSPATPSARSRCTSGTHRDRVVFASELGALRGPPTASTRRSTPTPLATYLQLGYVPAPLSIYEGVTKLEPGEWRRYAPAARVRQGVTTPASATPRRSTPTHLLEVLADAVAIRTVADVPVGVFLSGGIDSTLVAALAAQRRDRPTPSPPRSAGRATTNPSTPSGSPGRSAPIHTALPVAAGDGLDARSRAYRPSTASPSAIPRPSPPTSSPRQARGRWASPSPATGATSCSAATTAWCRGPVSTGCAGGLPARARGPGWRRSPAEPSRRASTGGGGASAAQRRRAPIPNLGEKLQKAAAVLGAPDTPAAITALVAMWADPGVLVDAGRPRPLGIGGEAFDEELLGARPAPDAARADADQGRPGHHGRRRSRRGRRCSTPASWPSPRRALDRSARPGRCRQAAPAGPRAPAHRSGPARSTEDGVRPADRRVAARSAPDVGGRAARARRSAGRPASRASTRSARRWSAHLDGSSSEEYRLWTLLQYQLWHRTEHQRRPTPAPVPAAVTAKSRGVELRPATSADQPAVHRLLAAAMSFDPDDDRFAWLLRWKHQENPFGRVARVGRRQRRRDRRLPGLHAVAVRRARARPWSAVRAVDTATDPTHQGRGIFRVAHPARPRGAARRGRRLRLQHAERPEPARLPQDGLAARRPADAVDPARGGPVLARIARGTRRAATGASTARPERRLPRPSPTMTP